ncbi:MAG: DNA-directed RNA polymerase subunit beta, partial [bacterium]
MGNSKCRWERKSFAKIPSVMEVPNLIEIQKGSYERFLQYGQPPEKRREIGLHSVFTSVFPIYDLKGISSLEFVKYSFGKPKYDIVECRKRGGTYAAPLKVFVRLVLCEKDKDQENRTVKDVKEQEIYLGDIPLMTDQGTFIINGTERTVVSQMHRSPGVFFGKEVVKDQLGRVTFLARIIPYRGSWVEFEVGHDETVQMRIDRRRKLPATLLLRSAGLEKDEEILKEFYRIEEVELSSDKVKITLNPDIHVGMKVNDDIFDDKKNILVKAGHKITKGVFRKMEKADTVSLNTKISYLKGKITAVDIVDENSGDLLAPCNSELDESSIATIVEAGIKRLSLLGVSGTQDMVI